MVGASPRSGRGKYRSHHLGVVVEVEAVPGTLGDSLHALLEASKGVLAALWVGVVRGKEEQVVTALVDQPADGLGREGRPSSQVPWSAISDYDAQVNVLMVCGFDLARTVEEFQRVRDRAPWPELTGETYAVDGSAYFSRPGPRIVDGLEVLAEIVHPELFPRTKPVDAWERVL